MEHTGLHSSTHTRKTGKPRADNAGEKRKEKKRSLQPDESFEDRHPERTPAAGGLTGARRIARSASARPEQHPGPSSGLCCPLSPQAKEKRSTHFTVWTSCSVCHGEKAGSTGSHDRSRVWLRTAGYHRRFQGGKTGSIYQDDKRMLPSVPPLHFYRYTPHEYKMTSVQGCSLQRWLQHISENNGPVHL